MAGIPTGLVLFIGWPFPHQLPKTWDDAAAILAGGFPDTAVVSLLAVALWLAWAAFCHALVVEFRAARGDRPVRHIRPRSPAHALAALLVAGLVAGPAAASVAVTTPSPAAVSYPSAVAGPTDGQAVTPVAAWPGIAAGAGSSSATSVDLGGSRLPRFALAARTGHLTVSAAGRRYTVTVQRGDTLWDLAQAWLGDPRRWPEIYRLNADRYDQHGRMRGGDHIEPTWVLTLPDDARPPQGATQQGPEPADAPQQNPGGQQTLGEPTCPSPEHPTAPSSDAKPEPSSSTVPAPSPSASTAPPSDSNGIIGPPPGAAPASSAAVSGSPTAGTPPPSAGEPAATGNPDGQAHEPPGVTLPSGSWLDLGLATAIVAAAALVWAHRRRRYTRRPPSPQLRLDDPDVAPMPPVVNQIRRRLRQAGRGTLTADEKQCPQDLDAGGDVVDEDVRMPAVGDSPGPDAGLDLLGQVREDLDEDGDDLDDGPDDGDEEVDGQASVSRPDLVSGSGRPRPAVPSLAHPLATVWPPAGLGLTGPGAQAAARGFLAAALAAGGLDYHDERSWVVMPSATAATLLGTRAIALAQTPRLTVTAGLDEALELLETQALHRSRIVYSHEVDTVAEVRAGDPTEEPLPPILLLADATTRHQRTRICALLTQGQRLDIHGVMLGVWPHGDTVVVAADGSTNRADGDGSRHGDHPADIGRLATLTPAETSDLLATLAESHTGAPQAPAPDAAQASTPTPTAAPTAAEIGPSGVDLSGLAADAPADTAHVSATGGDDPAVVFAPGEMDGTDNDGTADGRSGDETGPGRVAVRVLGPAGILDVPPGPAPRKRSVEVLVYLAVHDGEASAESILDDLMPEAPAAKAPGRLYTYVSDLRTIMRRTGGPGTYVTHPRQRYALNRDTVDVDLWRMRAAIREADRATDPAGRITALRRAVDIYVGHLAEGADYEWIEPYREAVRQQALDAYLALVDALADNPAEQITVLDAAIHHNPYVEDLYQRAMRARAALGHLDAVRTMRRALTRALAEIDAEPADETIALAEQLVTQARRPGRRPDLRPTPRPHNAADDGAAA